MVERLAMTPADLRAIAVYQKGVLVCIVVYLVLVLVQFAVPPGLRIFLAIPGLAVSVTGTVFVFLLAIRVYTTGHGILLGLLTLIPVVGLVVLLIMSIKATSVLKAHGVRVGLLGANMSDFN